jgi:hypothetical protein
MIGWSISEADQNVGLRVACWATLCPTLSEMMHESVLDAYDRVIHI